MGWETRKTIIIEIKIKRIKCHVLLMREEEVKMFCHMYGSKLPALGTRVRLLEIA